ncbi:coiled-coil-helix-coiled-coil-helix domain-containing protein 1 [Chelonia mydas]|uniref:Coiled-coil-helix-coiled-coil-helix domain-containing protein 1 n=1 Tax=Chelonia mydas TaxID=8469 RepID=M7B4Q4_CHEMY|nr:coiled-coil-helix-coiled-coil-helix domain-containing protein 1 [Chelonia mydas]EMP27128.1 Coiled-coil-helix-coiled-coil-helix domain-containing protein 1 [Chelonia mydas]
MAAPVYPAWLGRLATRQQRWVPTMCPTRPLVLANQVANCRLHLGEAMCTTEMSLPMACWKQNEFSDAACAKEIQTFYDCVAKTDAEHKERLKQESLGQMGNLSPKTVNKLLRRFPNSTDDF